MILGIDTTICSGETLTLDAGNAGINYIWSTGETTQTITVNTSNTYFVKVNDFTCEATDTIVVNVAATPVVSIQASKLIICPNEEVTLEAFGATTYTWEDASASVTRTVAPTQTTVYSVTGKTGICESSAQISIAVKTNGCVTDTASIDEVNAIKVAMYPNPADKAITLEGEELSQYFSTYSITDMTGRHIATATISSNIIEVPTEKLQNGVYFISLLGQKVKTIKIEVKH